MTINIRKYNDDDFSKIQEFMEKLTDYLIGIDPMKRLRRMNGYGKSYTERFFEKVKTMSGEIYIAEIDGKMIGLAGGVIEEQSPENLLECVPTRAGRVIEIIVSDEFRSQNIGATLMAKMEEYFMQNGCDILKVEVFEPNKSAHAFYEKCGYADRAIDMIKKI